MSQPSTSNPKPFINLPQIYSMQLNGPTFTRNSKTANQSVFENQSNSKTTRKLQVESHSIFELQQRERTRGIS